MSESVAGYFESAESIIWLYKALRLVPKGGNTPTISYRGNFPIKEPDFSDATDFFDETTLDEISKLNRLSRQQLLEKPVAVVTRGEDTLEDEFKERATEWRRDTKGVSSLTDLFMHPAYQRIMGMGTPALRYILSDLRQNSGHWFHALAHIAGKDHAAGTRNVEDATSAWLEWGYKNGYI